MPNAPTVTPAAHRTAGPSGVRPAGAWLLWCAAALAVAAAAVSGYLLWLSIAEAGAPAGCGPESGCQQVLDSRWSTWLGIPVSGPGVGVYVVIAIASVVTAVATRPAWRRWAITVLLGSSVLAAGAGTWFVLLQFAQLHHVCPYCLAVHACGITIFVMVAAWLLRNRRRGTDGGGPVVGRWPATAATGLAVVGVAALVGGQVVRTPPPPAASRVYTARLAGGPVDVDLSQLPLLGRPDAKYSVVVLADYSCHFCRTLHGNLQAALPRYGNQVAFAVVPVPLSHDCNPTIKRTYPDHQYACDYARLALAVWRAKPEAYGAMDAFLFGPERPPAVADARRRAAELLGGDAALARAEADPWVAQRLKDDIALYQRAGGGAMPKLIFQDHAVSSPPEDTRKLFELLEYELHVKPVGP